MAVSITDKQIKIQMKMGSYFTYLIKTPFSLNVKSSVNFAVFTNKVPGTLPAFVLIFMVLFSVASLNVNAQDRITVKGVVVDDKDGGTLPGVSITDNQKRNLAVTNINGSFTINIPAGSIVLFNFIGYQVSSKTFNKDEARVTVRLKTDISELNEVVVTALGIRREEKSLGYATTTVKGDQLTDAVSSNWTDALSGKVAGLNLVRSNSGPTGSNKIILRGENNLTGNNEALIVVDGVVINGSSGRRTANAGEATYGTGSENMLPIMGAV